MNKIQYGTMDKPLSINNPDFTKTGNSVWNQQYMEYLTENYFPNIDPATLPQEQDTFLANYPKWIASSKLNKFKGLDAFKHRFVSLGVTQALDYWHYWCQANGYNLKVYRGEYPYNRDAQINNPMEWGDSIDDIPLQKGDAVIVSVPFSGTGKKPEHWQKLINTCNDLDIPVFVDCAWFGTCFGIEINLNEECIKMVAFSTTKGLSCGNWRSGITFSRENKGSLAVQTEWYHGIHLNLAIANSLMKEFSPDTIAKKYKEAHVAVCEHYGFETTNTVHIGIAPAGPDWDAYHRDGTYNRINIAKAIKRYKNKGNFYE
jgi:hypothetical protein